MSTTGKNKRINIDSSTDVSDNEVQPVRRKRASYTVKIFKGFRKLISPVRLPVSNVDTSNLVSEREVSNKLCEESSTNNSITSDQVSAKSYPSIDTCSAEKDTDTIEPETKCTPILLIGDPVPIEDIETQIFNANNVEERGGIISEFVNSYSPDSDIITPSPEIFRPSPKSSECSWFPFYDCIAPLFCLPPSHISSSTLEEPEIMVFPPYQKPFNQSAIEENVVSSFAESSTTVPSFYDRSVKKEIDLNEKQLAYGLSLGYLNRFIEDTFDKAKNYLGLSDTRHMRLPWVLQSLKNDIEVYSCNFPGDNTIVVKSKYKVASPIQVVQDMLLSEETMQTLDPTLEKFENLLRLPEPRVVLRKYLYKAYFPISPRDFVAVTSWMPVENGVLIVTSSMSDAHFPPTHGYVRGYIVLSAFYLQSLSRNSTEVTVINHANVSATVPSYILNKAASNIPIQYAKSLRKLCSDQHT